MTIIDYTSTELLFAEKDGNFEIIIFSDFINTLLDLKISNQIQKSILLKVDKDGTKILTEEEKSILYQIIFKYSKICVICGEEVPLSEHLINDNTIYCSYHKRYTIDKN